MSQVNDPVLGLVRYLQTEYTGEDVVRNYQTASRHLKAFRVELPHVKGSQWKHHAFTGKELAGLSQDKHLSHQARAGAAWLATPEGQAHWAAPAAGALSKGVKPDTTLSAGELEKAIGTRKAEADDVARNSETLADLQVAIVSKKIVDAPIDLWKQLIQNDQESQTQVQSAGVV